MAVALRAVGDVERGARCGRVEGVALLEQRACLRRILAPRREALLEQRGGLLARVGIGGGGVHHQRDEGEREASRHRDQHHLTRSGGQAHVDLAMAET